MRLVAAAVWVQLVAAAADARWNYCAGNMVRVFPDCPGKGCYGTAWERNGWVPRECLKLQKPHHGAASSSERLPWLRIRLAHCTRRLQILSPGDAVPPDAELSS